MTRSDANLILDWYIYNWDTRYRKDSFRLGKAIAYRQVLCRIFNLHFTDHESFVRDIKDAITQGNFENDQLTERLD